MSQSTSNHTLTLLAEYYYRDAVDFGRRFDLLWEAGSLMHKMGRIKSFVDLMVGCECALKCDRLLAGFGEEPTEVYRRVRECSHDIRKLLGLPGYSKEANVHKIFNGTFADLYVHMRYSYEADHAFFNFSSEGDSQHLKYSRTIGDSQWVLAIRETLEALNRSVSKEFSGEVSGGIAEFLADDMAMKALKQARKVNQIKK